MYHLTRSVLSGCDDKPPKTDLVNDFHQLCDSSVRINGDQSSAVMMMVVMMVEIRTSCLVRAWIQARPLLCLVPGEFNRFQGWC